MTLFAAGSANAALYVENTCTYNSDTNDTAWSNTSGEGWYIWPNCPDGVALANIYDLHLGDPREESFLETTRGEIQSITAYLRHPGGVGVGLEGSVQVCRLTTCGASVTSTEEATPVELTRENLQIPKDATRVVFRARCVIATCFVGEPVVLSDLVVTRNDDTPPNIAFFYEANDDGSPVSPTGSKWSNGELKYNFDYADLESYGEYFEVQIEGLRRCGSLYYDSLIVPGCQMFEAHVEAPRYFASDLEDGHHEVTLIVANRAGLTTTRSYTVKTDTTRPARPSQFQLTPRFNGWVNSRDVRIDWTNAGETLETETQSGIAGYRYDVSPMNSEDNPPVSDEDPPEVSVTEANAHSLQYRFPSTGDWEVALKTFDRAGNESDVGTVEVDIDSVRPPAPVVHPIPPINASDAINGKTIAWDSVPPPVSGICGFDWAFAAIAGFNPGEDPATPLLGGSPTQLTLTPSQVQALDEKPQKFHIRAYSCAGSGGEIAHIPVIVDRTAPSIAISPSGGTIRGDEPVSIAVQDAKSGTIQSGIATVDCEVNGDPIPCANGSQLMLGGGQRDLVVVTTDNAGNSTSADAHLNVDSSEPDGWIEAADPADPTLVRASVRDADSGIKTAVLEYKPTAGGSWTRLGDGFSSTNPTSGSIALSARIPDEGELADGGYLLRVHATDGASTSALITRRVGGEPASFQIPLRAASSLTAGLKKTSSAKSSALTRLEVAYGASPVLVGTLKRGDGSRIGGALLSIGAEQAGSPAHTVGFVTTGADGRYSWRVPSGASRTFGVRFGGSFAVRGTSAAARLRVGGKVTLTVSASVVRSMHAVHLRGKVLANGAAIPLIGKLVFLRFATTGRGSSKQTLRTDAAGRYDYSFKYRARKRAVRFTVRAISPAEPTWAYETGSSGSESFVVRP
jgi:hypothetical protein